MPFAVAQENLSSREEHLAVSMPSVNKNIVRWSRIRHRRQGETKDTA